MCEARSGAGSLSDEHVDRRSPAHQRRGQSFAGDVINRVVAVPVMVPLMILASRKSVMGGFRLNRPLKSMGWLAAAGLIVTSVD